MQLGWWKSITFHQHTGEDLCLERMGGSENKGCNNWKRIEYYCIKTFTKMTLETCMHVSKRHYVTKGIFNVNGDYGQLTQDQLFTYKYELLVDIVRTALLLLSTYGPAVVFLLTLTLLYL